LQDAAADAAAEAEEAAAAILAEAKERVQASKCCWALAAFAAFFFCALPPKILFALPASGPASNCVLATNKTPPLLQVAVAAAVAEKDAQLHAAQEALKRQLQQQLQRAEAEMEVGCWGPLPSLCTACACPPAAGCMCLSGTSVQAAPASPAAPAA
jgi:hypothetical protein